MGRVHSGAGYDAGRGGSGLNSLMPQKRTLANAKTGTRQSPTWGSSHMSA